MATATTVLVGSNLDLLPHLPENSIDAIVTDPPYGLAFMDKAWDKALPDPETWAECFRVLKPGGHMVAFGSPRLYHRLACQIEDSAPWEIRDCLMWLYGSGFPKSHDVSKAIDKTLGVTPRGYRVNPADRPGYGKGVKTSTGWRMPKRPPKPIATSEDAIKWEGFGTALKPAWEPIILCRKPLAGTVAKNVLEHGTGALNIDGCRIATDDDTSGRAGIRAPLAGDIRDSSGAGMFGVCAALVDTGGHDAGRWPANLILDEEAGALLDEQVSSVSRFFYCAKASRAEREAGLPDPPEGQTRGNMHPTVKPMALMRWLVRLITPPGGVVLDPFNGSGSTGCAAVSEGFRYIGMEIDETHAAISRARIEHWKEQLDG